MKCPGNAILIVEVAFSDWLFWPVTLSSLRCALSRFQVSLREKREGPLCWALAYLCCAHYRPAAGEAQDDQPQVPHGVRLPVCDPPLRPQGFMRLELAGSPR